MNKIKWAASCTLAFICATGVGGWEAARWESFKKRAIAEMAPSNSARLAMVGRAAELSREGADAPSAVKVAVDAAQSAYDDPLAYLIFARFASRALSDPSWRDSKGVEHPWTVADKASAREQALRLVQLFEKGRLKGWVDAREDERVERIAHQEPSLTVAWRAREILEARRSGARERQEKAGATIQALSQLAAR